MPAAHEEPAKYQTRTAASADAPWLVMVHGASQNHTVFDRQAEVFGADFRLLLIDLPGHGLSADLPGPYGAMEYAASIAGAMDRAGVERCHYWGTHTGAVTGLLLACRDAARFRSLVLEGPFNAGRPLPSVQSLPPKVAAVAQSESVAAARDLWWQEGRWFDVIRSRPEACRAAAKRRMIDDFDGAPWLYKGPAPAEVPDISGDFAELRVPALIINGEHDLPDFLDAGEALANTLPDCRRVLTPDAGGFPLWEFPDRVNPVVAEFLTGQLALGS